MGSSVNLKGGVESNPGEDRFKSSPNFDSPNFESADDRADVASVDAEVEECKKRETVAIDGIPIDDENVKFRAEDIKKKKKQEYFVNVEGAEKRAREAAKQARAEQIAEEKELKAEAAAEEKAKKEKELVEKKKDQDLKKTLLGKAHQRRKENKKVARSEFLKRNKKKFIFASIVVVLIIAGVVAGIFIKKKIDSDTVVAEEKHLKALADEDVRIKAEGMMGDFFSYTSFWEAYDSFTPLLNDVETDVQKSIVLSVRAHFTHDRIMIDKMNDKEAKKAVLDDLAKAYDYAPRDEYACRLRNYAVEYEMNPDYQKYIDICEEAEKAAPEAPVIHFGDSGGKG